MFIPFLPQADSIIPWPAGPPDAKVPDASLLNSLVDNVYLLESSPLIRRSAPVFCKGEACQKSTRILDVKLATIYFSLLRNAKVLGRTVAVINKTRVILGDVSIDWRFPRTNHRFRGWKFLPYPKKVSGKTLCLAATGAETFSHLLFDSLSRIWLAEKSGFSPKDFDFLLVQNDSPALKSFLYLFGWGDLPTLNLSKLRHLSFSDLYVGSYQSGIGHYHPQFIRWVRKKVLSNKIIPKYKSSLIFLTRSDANSRRLLNENEILKAFSKNGTVQILTLKNMSLFEQIGHFLNTQGVIAPHGAGLTHLIWAPSNIPVLEFFPEGFFNGYYWELASAVKQNYLCLEGKNNQGGERQTSDYFVDLNDINEAKKFILF
ncbi:MAG: DUF563 domain-containing protein [Verrucomicrobia bacterium]|nr:DUF563 domain-containing protein [Verrucomicrobiota bacterium]